MNKTAFTLIEFLIVAVILSLLFAIVIPQFAAISPECSGKCHSTTGTIAPADDPAGRIEFIHPDCPLHGQPSR